ncbi:hypothetical protein QBC34DRAFT_55268 [Podospora aff. communis PSN243]|uniref:Uncharacterized protein n=1 Tax=Podospora aff. communis PSN243 TaxID=3040156 RepID=A0AAV9GXW4_9PEZI|nr:hypothetical protein QBC34DRAFT_55268 [Podospora aff. communis PSN243]
MPHSNIPNVTRARGHVEVHGRQDKAVSGRGRRSDAIATQLSGQQWRERRALSAGEQRRGAAEKFPALLHLSHGLAAASQHRAREEKAARMADMGRWDAMDAHMPESSTSLSAFPASHLLWNRRAFLVWARLHHPSSTVQEPSLPQQRLPSAYWCSRSCALEVPWAEITWSKIDGIAAICVFVPYQRTCSRFSPAHMYSCRHQAADPALRKTDGLRAKVGDMSGMLPQKASLGERSWQGRPGVIQRSPPIPDLVWEGGLEWQSQDFLATRSATSQARKKCPSSTSPARSSSVEPGPGPNPHPPLPRRCCGRLFLPNGSDVL